MRERRERGSSGAWAAGALLLLPLQRATRSTARRALKASREKVAPIARAHQAKGGGQLRECRRGTCVNLACASVTLPQPSFFLSQHQVAFSKVQAASSSPAWQSKRFSSPPESDTSLGAGNSFVPIHPLGVPEPLSSTTSLEHPMWWKVQHQSTWSAVHATLSLKSPRKQSYSPGDLVVVVTVLVHPTFLFAQHQAWRGSDQMKRKSSKPMRQS